MNKDPALTTFVWLIGAFLCVGLATVIGVFVVLPLGALFIIYLIVSKINAPKEMSNEELHKLATAEFPTDEAFLDSFIDKMLSRREYTVWQVTREVCGIAHVFYNAESFGVGPLLKFTPGSIYEGRYRDRLMAAQEKAADAKKTVEAFSEILFDAVHGFNKTLPALAKDERYFTSTAPKPPTTVPLIDVLPDVHETIAALTEPFFSEKAKSLDLFKGVRESLEENQEALKKSKPDSQRKFVEAALKGTTLEDLFTAEVPFEIPQSRWLEHAVIVAGSGHGKTQSLGAIITRHLEEEEPPALVVIDSTGALVKRIQTLAIFNDRLKDRIIIIDPEHDPAPALNMFDIETARLKSYSRSERDEVETDIVNLFNYVFTSASNDLTSRQGTVFSYVVRLVLSMPNSTVNTLRQVLEEDPKGGYPNSKYRPQIEKLDETAQDFFKNQYFELKGFREQIAQRVYGLVQIPAFQRMFSSTNKVDFFDELQNKGSIILVNTSERVLKENGSPLFGRYIIARTLASAFERATIPEQNRRPTFLIIDEAAPYFDDTFDKILTRVRQFKLGVCVAFQHMEQVSEKLRSSIASNTSVKLAGGLGYADSRWLSRDMETTPEFLKAQKRDSAEPPNWTQLACYVRNYTPHAVSLTIPFYRLENMPHMSPAEHRALLERNRERVSAPPRESAPLIVETAAPPKADSPPESPTATPTPRPPAKSTPEPDAATEWS